MSIHPTPKNMIIQEAKHMLEGVPIQSNDPQRWLDLGCGAGTFTMALAALLPPGSEVIGIDRTFQQLPEKSENGVGISFQQLDMKHAIEQPFQVNGILMANSLHYIKHQTTYLKELEKLMIDGVHFILVEYDTSRGNPWVPFPIQYDQLRTLFPEKEVTITKLGERESIYGGTKMYAAHITYEQ